MYYTICFLSGVMFFISGIINIISGDMNAVFPCFGAVCFSFACGIEMKNKADT